MGLVKAANNRYDMNKHIHIHMYNIVYCIYCACENNVTASYKIKRYATSARIERVGQIQLMSFFFLNVTLIHFSGANNFLQTYGRFHLAPFRPMLYGSSVILYFISSYFISLYSSFYDVERIIFCIRFIFLLLLSLFYLLLFFV